VTPKAEIRLLKGGTLLYPRLSQAVAKDLAQRLYEDVVLEGRATWRTDTWEVVDFRVDSVSPFRTAPPHEAFEALAEVAEGRWDEEDAVEYVHCLRGSGPVGEP
jgi:hypothetical protein